MANDQDQGRQFESNLFSEFNYLMNISDTSMTLSEDFIRNGNTNISEKYLFLIKMLHIWIEVFYYK